MQKKEAEKQANLEIETHPFEPWLPKNARLLMLGTFPPAPKRWCMEWYYPNFQNDMWRIFGYLFFGDKMHFVDQSTRLSTLMLSRHCSRKRELPSSIRHFASDVPRTTPPTRTLKSLNQATLTTCFAAFPHAKAY